MVKYVVERFLDRNPKYRKTENFTKNFFFVIQRAMTNMRTHVSNRNGKMMSFMSEEMCWSKAFYAGLPLNHQLMTNQRLVCGISLALYDAGMIGWATIRRVIDDHPNVSIAYFKKWIEADLEEIRDYKMKDDVIAIEQEADDLKSDIVKNRSINGLKRILNV